MGNEYWNGWWDEPNEGVWQDVNSGEPLGNASFAQWYLGEPNGNTLENCGVTWAVRNAWNDIPCHKIYCGYCELERAPDLQIRGKFIQKSNNDITQYDPGLCSKTKFDQRYSWTWSKLNGRHSFRGFIDTLLYWDDVNRQWKLDSYSNPKLTASMGEFEYPLGTFKWTINNDPCFKGNQTDVVLNINTCSDKEFNCLDGFCVNIGQRCDGKVDCPDKTGDKKT